MRRTQSDPAVVCLWPCNLRAWEIFMACQTQWRTGMGGATGLDYTAVRATMDLLGVAKKHRNRLFEGVRTAEGAALLAWGERA